MKHNDKPSLDELFQSKKLDVPSDDFWDDFQDRVRDRALTSVVQRSRFTITPKTIIFSFSASVACLLAIFFYFQPSSSTVEFPEFVQESKETTKTSDAVFLDDLVGQDVEVVSSYVVDSKLSDQSLYVHHELEWADEESSFEEHTIKEKEFQQPDLFAQFTF